MAKVMEYGITVQDQAIKEAREVEAQGMDNLELVMEIKRTQQNLDVLDVKAPIFISVFSWYMVLKDEQASRIPFDMEAKEQSLVKVTQDLEHLSHNLAYGHRTVGQDILEQALSLIRTLQGMAQQEYLDVL